MTPAPKRRWFRFSLRTLFVVVTVLSVWLGWLTWELKVIRERQSMRQWIEGGQNGSVITVSMGGSAASRGGKPLQTIPIWRRWLGDEPVAFINLPDNLTREKRQRMPRCFPEAVIYGRHDYRWPGARREVIYAPPALSRHFPATGRTR